MTAENEKEICVIASIQPVWNHKILIREKLYEVRKTGPNIPTPFRCLIYCTRNRLRMDVNNDILYWPPGGKCQYGCPMEVRIHNTLDSIPGILNGKVIAEFICDEILTFNPARNEDGELGYEIPTAIGELTGMDYGQAFAYGGGKPLYFWHISELKKYENPLTLAEIGLKAAPQSWQYVVLEAS